MESKALELASRVFTGAAFTSRNLREEAYKHHVCIPPAFVLEFKDSDLMIQWSMVHWTMIKVNKCPLCDNKGDYDTVLYTEGYRRGYAENLCLEHCSSRNKEDKHSIVIREHPHGHWRVACMVQHTRMPAYCVPYLRERTKIKIVHTTGRRGPTYLRFLHLVLGIHLCDDFIHVGLQDHPSHHHFCQNVVDLQTTWCCEWAAHEWKRLHTWPD